MSNIVYLKSFRINEKYMMFIQFFKYKLLKFAVIKEAYLEQFCQKIVFHVIHLVCCTGIFSELLPFNSFPHICICSVHMGKWNGLISKN